MAAKFWFFVTHQDAQAWLELKIIQLQLRSLSHLFEK
jgi:hypothetical protein